MISESTPHILGIVGPTASGKSSRAVEIALTRRGEVISVDSRQVYRGLDIGTEKITQEEMRGVPHHLIDICDPNDAYSAGDFVKDASGLIEEIHRRGNLPILVGGTHFYFDALLKGLPMGVDTNPALRDQLDQLSTEELYTRVSSLDARRAKELDPQNRRRLIRALEIISEQGKVPTRAPQRETSYTTEWTVIDPPGEELRKRIDERLVSAFSRGLIDEVRHVREMVGDTRVQEFGLEYKIISEFLRSEREESTLLPALSAKLWQYARRQKAWLRKLREEEIIVEGP